MERTKTTTATTTTKAHHITRWKRWNLEKNKHWTELSQAELSWAKLNWYAMHSFSIIFHSKNSEMKRKTEAEEREKLTIDIVSEDKLNIHCKMAKNPNKMITHPEECVTAWDWNMCDVCENGRFEIKQEELVNGTMWEYKMKKKKKTQEIVGKSEKMKWLWKICSYQILPPIQMVFEIFYILEKWVWWVRALFPSDNRSDCKAVRERK